MGVADYVSGPPDAIEMPEKATRELMAGELRVELRGYEVGRKLPSGTWAQVAAYRPNETARHHAIADARWLQERHPNEEYRVRAIVSLEPPELVREPLVVEADPTDPAELMAAAESFEGIDRGVAE